MTCTLTAIEKAAGLLELHYAVVFQCKCVWPCVSALKNITQIYFKAASVYAAAGMSARAGALSQNEIKR